MSGLSTPDGGRFRDWFLGSLCLRVRLGLRWSMEGLLSVGAETTTAVGKTMEVGKGRPRVSVVVVDVLGGKG